MLQHQLPTSNGITRRIVCGDLKRDAPTMKGPIMGLVIPSASSAKSRLLAELADGMKASARAMQHETLVRLYEIEGLGFRVLGLG